MIAPSLLTPFDLHLFNEGTHGHLYEKLGAHLSTDPDGATFAVWAPNADSVSVIGDFNSWDKTANQLHPREQSGIWEGFVPGVGHGALYKYHVHSRVTRTGMDKADPFAAFSEAPPRQASIVWDLTYDWGDGAWMSERSRANGRQAPWSVYELHIGSWMRVPEDNNRWLTYRELAPKLADYTLSLGFTHVELMPVMEHPLYQSWGYQVEGYFAPTSRYGTPQDFMYMVDHLHQRGLGVILDWVPSHFPTDEFGLQNFDGTHLFEHADPRLGLHPDWGSSIFNYGRNEVRGFLMSSALSWLHRYHADGLRVDGVASMLYLDYSRKQGEWIPNKFGGRENLEAVDFLRRFNIEVYKERPDTQTIAEESTSWPMVSRPTYLGGLGFGMKWDMGWMHDTLEYLAHDPVHRRFHHNQLTFRGMYAFTENFVLPLSHDEVVHLKESLLEKMPGDDWQKFANLRALFAYQIAQPGKKLVFMGGEFGQRHEWAHDSSLDWHLLEQPLHAGVQRCLGDLNRLYAAEPSLHQLDMDPAGFEWIDANDSEASVITFLRRSRTPGEEVLFAANFTPLVRSNYMVGVPSDGYWRELLNTDAADYGGTGVGNMGGVDAVPIPLHGRPFSLNLTLPPLACVFLKRDRS